MEDKKARGIHICQSVILFFAECLCLSFPFFFVIVRGEALHYVLIDWLIDLFIKNIYAYKKQFRTAAKHIVSL